MILTCNSCQKSLWCLIKQSVAGRLVQCGPCGNKWKQFPVGKVKYPNNLRTQNSFETSAGSKIQKPKKVKTTPKTREISLYSPEYLAKKHGIKINDVQPEKISKQEKGNFWIL